MGCDGCLRAALCENRTWCGSVCVQTMGRELGSSLQACLPSLSLTHTRMHTSSSLRSLFVHPFSPCFSFSLSYLLRLPLQSIISPSPPSSSFMPSPPLVFAMLLFLGSARVRAVECFWQPHPASFSSIPMLGHCGWD